MKDIPSQLELDFDASATGHPPPDGLALWRAQWRAEDEAESRRLGLPLRQLVEVQLECGALLRGRLEPAEPELLRLDHRPARLTLRIGHTVFEHRQIARCLALELPEKTSDPEAPQRPLA